MSSGAMQMMMEAELQREVTRRQYEQRKGVIQSALNSTLENDKAIEAVLFSKVIVLGYALQQGNSLMLYFSVR